MRIAEALESQFAEIAETQPELLARHYTEAGQIEKAAGLWGEAGQRSLERSALVEAVAQLTRALAQIAALPTTHTLRSEQIKLQVALASTLFHVKGYRFDWFAGVPFHRVPRRLTGIVAGGRFTLEVAYSCSLTVRYEANSLSSALASFRSSSRSSVP